MAISKLLKINEDKKHGDVHSHLKNSIFYICNPEKTEGGRFIGGNSGSTPETVLQTICMNKEYWNKPGDRQGFHYILSFSSDDPVNEELVDRIAQEFADELLKDRFYYVTAVHNDKKHLHAHLIFDSVSKEDGYKFHSPKGDWEKRIQPILDSLCQKYHLSTLEYEKDGDRKGKNYKEWENAKGDGERSEQYSPYDIIRDDIDEAIARSDTYAAFLKKLQEMKYTITRDSKYLSLKPEFRERAIRTSRLGSGYGKEDIQKRIFMKEHELSVLDHYRHYGDMKEAREAIYMRVKKQPGWKLSRMQKKYYSRLFRIYHIRRPYYYDQSWRYKKDILQVKKLSRCIVEMTKYDLRTNEDVNVRKAELKEQLATVQAELKSKRTRLYQGRINQLLREYENTDPADEEKRNKLYQEIEAVKPFTAAVDERELLKSEIRILQSARSDLKKEIQTCMDIEALQLQPEHQMEAMISADGRNRYCDEYIKQQKKKRFPDR